MRMVAMLLALGAVAAAETMEEAYEAKLKKEFFTNASWTTDYDAALEQARKEAKPIFAYFTRSYAP